MPLDQKRKQRFFRAALAVVSSFCVLLAVLTAAEVYLAVKESGTKETIEGIDLKLYEKKYHAFSKHHLHPFYFFFFPQDPKVIKEINNDMVSIDTRGFRGGTPEERGARKLAFILGGSAAFGKGASSNEATISGFLNKVQSEYYFVNAGVPGWNSTQEFYRLSLELLNYKPSLILVYDGANDTVHDYQHFMRGKPYPQGTTKGYDDLEQWVDDIRRGSRIKIINLTKIELRVFPRTLTRVGQIFRGVTPNSSAARDRYQNSAVSLEQLKQLAETGAQVYLRKQELMTRIATASGSKILFIWQPLFWQHQHISSRNRRLLGEENYGLYIPYLKYVHEAVSRVRNKDPEWADFSDIFDRYFDDVPVGNIFIDAVHLHDPGNEIVAREVDKILKRRESH